MRPPPSKKLESNRCRLRTAASNSDSASTLAACSMPRLSTFLTTQFRLNTGKRPGMDW